MKIQFALLLLGALISVSLVPTQSFSQAIVLRDLSLIENAKIARFDESGVELADQRKLNWDEIFSADHPDEAFHELHRRLSTPLYRLKRRFQNRDYAAAIEPAVTLQKELKNQKSENYRLAVYAELVGRIRESELELALVSLFRLLEVTGNPTDISPWVKQAQVKVDLESGFCDQLSPIFFDAEKSRNAMKLLGLKQSPDSSEWLPAQFVYATAICSAATETALAQKFAAKVDDSKLNSDWERISAIQLSLATNAEIDDLPRKINDQNSTMAKSMFQYLIGKSRLRADNLTEQKRGAIELLTVPAVFGTNQPEVSAAALHEVIGWFEKGKHPQEVESLKAELNSSFQHSFYGRKLRAEKTTHSNPRGSATSKSDN